MIKNLTRLNDIQTGEEWRVDRRTRGQDILVPGEKPKQTWVLIMSNRAGERRFIPETRVWEYFKNPDAKSTEAE